MNVLKLTDYRMSQISNIEAWTGRKESPYQPAELQAIGKLTRSLPFDQAASFLSQMGGKMGNADRVAMVAAQLNDKDDVLSMSMLAAGTQTTQGRDLAELFLRGDQALKDKVVTVDGAKESGWQASIAKAIEGVYPNREVANQTKRAAFLILAARLLSLIGDFTIWVDTFDGFGNGCLPPAFFGAVDRNHLVFKRLIAAKEQFSEVAALRCLGARRNHRHAQHVVLVVQLRRDHCHTIRIAHLPAHLRQERSSLVKRQAARQLAV